MTEAYCFAVTLIESRPLLWTVHTIDGAVFSRLPIQALKSKLKCDTSGDFVTLDPWGAISSNGQAIQQQYLKDYRVVSTKFDACGRYAFTIDYFDGGFSEDPLQHKTSNIIFLDSGDIAAWPNNWCRFVDNHFVEPGSGIDGYERKDTYWSL